MAAEPVSAAAAIDPPAPAHFARNAAAFVVDIGMWLFAMSFIGAGTVMPGLIAQLTPRAEVYVGLLNALITGLWLLPQLAVAGLITRRPYKKPLIVWAAVVSRPVMLVTALVIRFYALSRPMIALATILAGFSIFFIGDAVASVPWFDVLSRTIPSRRRGRVLGLSQIVGALLGILGGLGVRYALDPSGPWAYPTNYAALFVISSIAMIGSTVALACLVEPPPAAAEKASPPMREVIAMLPRILLGDKQFLRMNITRFFFSFMAMGSAFYVLYATRRQGLGPEVIGLFVSAQVAGSLISGLLMGVVQDRFGPLAHMRLAMAVSALPPLLALAAGLLFPALGAGVLPIYIALYVLLGVTAGFLGWPFMNWTMEYAGEAWRPLYLGITNTLGAAGMLAPVLGGWLAGTYSYPAVFVLSLVFGAVAALLSLPLLDTRKHPAQAQPGV